MICIRCYLLELEKEDLLEQLNRQKLKVNFWKQKVLRIKFTGFSLRGENLRLYESKLETEKQKFEELLKEKIKHNDEIFLHILEDHNE